MTKEEILCNAVDDLNAILFGVKMSATQRARITDAVKALEELN